MATSLFTNISDQLIRGSIRIKVLNHILAKKDIFTELVKIGKCRPAIFISVQISLMTVKLLHSWDPLLNLTLN